MSEFTFTEETEAERGFAAVFREKMVPILERQKAERRSLKAKAQKFMAGSGVVGIGGGGTAFMVEGPPEAGLIAAALGGIGAFGARAHFQKRWQHGLSGELLPIICDFLGEMTPGENRVDLGLARRLGVVPAHDNSHVEDPVTGTHRGLEWSLCEARLTTTSTDSKGRRTTSTVFRGLIMDIPLPQPVPRIFFARDRGGLGNWLSETFSSARKGLEKIEIGGPAFQATYEVYAADPGAAREVVNDQLMDGLLGIAANEAGGAHVAAAIEGRSFLLAMPRKTDFLGIGSLFKPLHGIEADLHEAFRDLTLPRRVIEALTGR